MMQCVKMSDQSSQNVKMVNDISDVKKIIFTGFLGDVIHYNALFDKLFRK